MKKSPSWKENKTYLQEIASHSILKKRKRPSSFGRLHNFAKKPSSGARLWRLIFYSVTC